MTMQKAEIKESKGIDKPWREGRTKTNIWCPLCREDVVMIPAENAAVICQCSRRKIYRWIEDGDLHFIETASGEVLICGKSLSHKIEDLDALTGKMKLSYETVIESC